MEGDRKSKFLLDEGYHESHPRISPDGRWMAYTSNEKKREEVYVRPFPDVNEGGRWQISTSGGDGPLWSPDGREIFYRNGHAVIAVSVKTSPTFILEASRTLFQGTYVAAINSPGGEFATWDIHPDGKRFLMIKESSAGGAGGFPRKINIVLNWLEELKRQVPAK